jgi:phospholipase/carboxylesterase
MSNTQSQLDAASDPHGRQPVLSIGPAPEKAAATLILIHGRGATAESILSLVPELGIENVAAMAPQAAGHTWYPYSFLEPIEENQPYLDSALRRIESLVADLLGRGIASEKIALLGFSQGACLSTEFVARHPRRYGAVMGLTGGLIGPPGTPRDYPGRLDETPIFLGCGDPDPHIPFERVRETAATFTRMGAVVDMRRYPGRPHTVSEDEVEACRALLLQVTSG